MKNRLTWILFFSYFAIFIVVCAVFYIKYLDKYINVGAETVNPEPEQADGKLYYAQENNIYQINPILTAGSLDANSQRIQSTGVSSNASISQNGQVLVYDSKNNLGYFDIWQVDLQSNNSSKIATRGQENLNGYMNFINPKFNGVGTKISFLGTSEQGFDTIYFKDISNNSFSELMVQPGIKISDYTWTKDGKYIVYCTSNSNVCWKQEIGKNQAQKILSLNVSKIIASQNQLIFIVQNNDSGNLYSSSLDGRNVKNLTDVSSPKSVTFFQSDLANENVVYEVKDGDTYNIYAIKPNGSNRLQLTTDGKSKHAVISPSGDKIAYIKQKDGIYVDTISKTNSSKISNGWENITLLVWR